LLFALCTASSIVAGTIAGEIRDARGTAIADAVLYAIPEGRSVPAPRVTAVMDQRDRMFIPHVLPIQTGTRVSFPNSDDIQHHVYSFSRPKSFQLPLYKGTPPEPVLFDKPGIVMLGCNIHDRMSAFIVIVDTPYFVKGNANGAVELKNLPPGRYQVHLWYPDVRRALPPVRVTVAGDERFDVTLTPSGIRIGRANVRS
jgi:plastocyanin